MYQIYNSKIRRKLFCKGCCRKVRDIQIVYFNLKIIARKLGRYEYYAYLAVCSTLKV